MSDLPLPDLLTAAVIAGCVAMSAMRGAVAEAGSLVAWIVAFVFAKAFALPFADIAFASFQPRALGLALAFASLFFAAWLAQKLIRSLLTAAVSAVGLGGINRLLGGMLGAVKGIMLVTLAVMVFSHTDLPDTESWQTSYSLPYFQALADAASTYIPLQNAYGGNGGHTAE